jgi:hypothetical protein
MKAWSRLNFVMLVGFATMFRARLRRIQKTNLNTYPGLAAKAAELLNRKVEPPAEIGRKALVSVRTNRGVVIQVSCHRGPQDSAASQPLRDDVRSHAGRRAGSHQSQPVEGHDWTSSPTGAVVSSPF